MRGTGRSCDAGSGYTASSGAGELGHSGQRKLPQQGMAMDMASAQVLESLGAEHAVHLAALK